VRKILIVDDQPIFCRGLKQVLGETPDLMPVCETGNGRQAIVRATSGAYDLVVLVLGMSTADGYELLAEIKRQKPRLPVLVLSMHSEEHVALGALRSGASGYLTKQCEPEELLTAIRKILEGGTYVSAFLAQRLLATLVERRAGAVSNHALSARENQIMCMIASGRTVSEIARQLSLSVKTVSTHRARILAKLELKNNADLVRYATQNQLVD
jgi:DNA-binding NarL/FixJ family response regulator